MGPKRNVFFTKLRKNKLLPNTGQLSTLRSAFHRTSESKFRFKARKRSEADEEIVEFQTNNRAVNATRAREDHMSGKGRKVTEPKPKPKQKLKPTTLLPDEGLPIVSLCQVGGHPFSITASAPPSATLVVARVAPFVLEGLLSGFASELSLLGEGITIEEVVTRAKSLGGGEEVVDVFVRFRN